MKIIELRRHTDNDGDALSEQGVSDAREIAGRLRPPYALWVSSGAQRATQTLALWQEVLGVEEPISNETGLRSAREDRWKEVYAEAGSSDLADMREADPDFVRDEAALLGAALGRVFDRLPDGGAAIACGHSPTNEAAVLGLTEVIVPPIGKGAGVRVTRSDSGDFEVLSLE